MGRLQWWHWFWVTHTPVNNSVTHWFSKLDLGRIIPLVCHQYPFWSKETCDHIPRKSYIKFFPEVLVIGAPKVTVQTIHACFCCSNSVFAVLRTQAALKVRDLSGFLCCVKETEIGVTAIRSFSFSVSASFEIPDQTVPLHAWTWKSDVSFSILSWVLQWPLLCSVQKPFSSLASPGC